MKFLKGLSIVLVFFLKLIGDLFKGLFLIGGIIGISGLFGPRE